MYLSVNLFGRFENLSYKYTLQINEVYDDGHGKAILLENMNTETYSVKMLTDIVTEIFENPNKAILWSGNKNEAVKKLCGIAVQYADVKVKINVPTVEEMTNRLL
jgi:hypothetical protein